MFGRRKKDHSGDQAPGWDAIDAACHRIYGDQRPHHVGYTPPAALSTNLQGCSAYDAGDHWHFVSYGLSELYRPGPDDDRASSGWGFELTLRAAKPLAGTDPPGWGFVMVNEMAKHVNGQQVLLRPGDRIDLGRPVTGSPDVEGAPETDCTVFAIAVDPQLGTIETVNGRVTFLQLVGVTAADEDEMVATSTEDVLNRARRVSPLLVLHP